MRLKVGLGLGLGLGRRFGAVAAVDGRLNIRFRKTMLVYIHGGSEGGCWWGVHGEGPSLSGDWPSCTRFTDLYLKADILVYK